MKSQSLARNFIKKETLAQVFPYEFFQISEMAFFTEHLRWMLLKGVSNFQTKSLKRERERERQTDRQTDRQTETARQREKSKECDCRQKQYYNILRQCNQVEETILSMFRIISKNASLAYRADAFLKS